MTSTPPTNPLAGKPAPPAMLVDLPKLITAYYSERPDPSVAAQRVAFGTSGHRGVSFQASFNEAHVLAMTQAICTLSQTTRHHRTLVPRLRHARAVCAGVRERAGSAGGAMKSR